MASRVWGLRLAPGPTCARVCCTDQVNGTTVMDWEWLLLTPTRKP